MVVMVIGAIVSGFNKGVADMLEQSGPKTFWAGRFFSGGVVISDGSDEMSPWRHNPPIRSEEHTSELQSQSNFVCRLLLEKKTSRRTSSRLAWQRPQAGSRR